MLFYFPLNPTKFKDSINSAIKLTRTLRIDQTTTLGVKNVKNLLDLFDLVFCQSWLDVSLVAKESPGVIGRNLFIGRCNCWTSQQG